MKRNVDKAQNPEEDTRRTSSGLDGLTIRLDAS